MKLLLLKILLQRRARDEGFTLPIVIGLGLVMILLGAISITTANEENITAITQNSKSDALAIAEVGVARYREMLDRNRTLAVNDSGQWTTETQVCNNNTNEAGTSDDNVPSLTAGTSNAIARNEDGQDFNNDGDTTDTLSIGTYSLVSYDYINDDDEDGVVSTLGIVNGFLDLTSDAVNKNARGRLKVQGTAPDGSEAQIEVEIPVRINPNDMTNLTPALWIGNSGISAANLGSNLTIGNGNVVISDPAIVTGTTRDGCRDFSTLASTSPRRPVISDNRNLPSIQKAVDNINEAAGAGIGDRTNDNIPTVRGRAITFGTTAVTEKAYKLKADDPARAATGSTVAFKASDCTNIKSCRYYYDPSGTGGLTYSGLDIVTDGVAKTTLLLQQDLTINATDTTDLTYPTGRNINVGSSSGFGSSDGFEIYVTGSGNDITINADNGRTINIRAFIHAPQGKLTITGNGTVNISGSVWVNDFENTTATVNISPDNIKTSGTAATGDKAYLFYTTTPGRTPKPLTGSPTNWKTEEVTP
jgi:Tfp pilus assembly protein PilX